MTQEQREALDEALAIIARPGGNAGDVCARPHVRAALEVLASRSDPGDLLHGAQLWALERGEGIWSPEELRDTYESSVDAAARERQAREEQGSQGEAGGAAPRGREPVGAALWPAADPWGRLWVQVDREIRGTAQYVDVPREVVERCRTDKGLAACVREALAAWALEHEGPSPDVPGAVRFRRTRVLKGPLDHVLCLTARDRREMARREAAMKSAETAGKERAA